MGVGPKGSKAAALKVPCPMSRGGSPLTHGAAAVHKCNRKQVALQKTKRRLG